MTVTTQPSTVSIQDVVNIALAKGFTPDQARVAGAVARSEGAPGQNIVGDKGTSFGPFQFHIGGQLDNFKSWLSGVFGTPVSTNQAASIANSSQELAVSYALDHYLGAAIRAGTAKGFSGPDLAYFASEFGQVSQFPGNAKKAYLDLFGSTPVDNSGGTTAPPATTNDPTKLPAILDPSDPSNIFTGDPLHLNDGVPILNTPIGSLKIPSGLIALVVGFVLLIVGALLTYTHIEKPSINVKMPQKQVGG